MRRRHGMLLSQDQKSGSCSLHTSFLLVSSQMKVTRTSNITCTPAVEDISTHLTNERLEKIYANNRRIGGDFTSIADGMVQ